MLNLNRWIVDPQAPVHLTDVRWPLCPIQLTCEESTEILQLRSARPLHSTNDHRKKEQVPIPEFRKGYTYELGEETVNRKFLFQGNFELTQCFQVRLFQGNFELTQCFQVSKKYGTTYTANRTRDLSHRIKRELRFFCFCFLITFFIFYFYI